MTGDPAAIFAIAFSLWQACQEVAEVKPLNLSEVYNGMDQFMRELMRISELFEGWSCKHVDFDKLNEVWPYLLQDQFGEACLEAMFATGLAAFDECDCLRVAVLLRLPVVFDDKLPIPVDVAASNPVPGAFFRTFRIQTARDTIDGESSSLYVAGDDPFDENFGPPYFNLYGVAENGVLEHIVSRPTYAETVAFVRKLAPEIDFSDAH